MSVISYFYTHVHSIIYANKVYLNHDSRFEAQSALKKDEKIFSKYFWE